MDLKDTLEFSINFLLYQRLRSSLTILGIVVGISSVILLVGLVQGLKADILSELEDFGPRTIVITPVNPESGASGGFVGPASAFAPTSGKLFEKDYERVKRLPGIKSITKVITGQTTATYKNKSINAAIFGIEAGIFDDTVPIEVDSGRFLEESDQRVASVGADVAEGFDEDVRTQSNIYLAEQKFRVIGVMKSTGNSFTPVDNVIFIPFDDARDLLNETLLMDEISGIRMTMDEGTDMDAAEERVENIMLASHRVTEAEKDFGIISPKFINEQFTEILDLLTLFLGAIASISLLVGGIGISNTMFMSVMERRKDIGVMKAVGATRTNIRNIFLVESSIMGLLGGFLGLVLAAAIGLALIYWLGLAFAFESLAIVGALLFSIVIGIISGTFPAIEAAKVEPMEALRYE